MDSLSDDLIWFFYGKMPSAGSQAIALFEPNNSDTSRLAFLDGLVRLAQPKFVNLWSENSQEKLAKELNKIIEVREIVARSLEVKAFSHDAVMALHELLGAMMVVGDFFDHVSKTMRLKLKTINISTELAFGISSFVVDLREIIQEHAQSPSLKIPAEKMTKLEDPLSTRLRRFLKAPAPESIERLVFWPEGYDAYPPSNFKFMIGVVAAVKEAFQENETLRKFLMNPVLRISNICMIVDPLEKHRRHPSVPSDDIRELSNIMVLMRNCFGRFAAEADQQNDPTSAGQHREVAEDVQTFIDGLNEILDKVGDKPKPERSSDAPSESERPTNGKVVTLESWRGKKRGDKKYSL